MSKRFAAALLLVSAISVPLSADFTEVARAIDAQRGVKRAWIPLLGFARVLVRMVKPEGVRDFQFAKFDMRENIDPKLFHDILRRKAGAGYVPLVQAWSKPSQEWSFVYARPSAISDRIELLILARDDSDTVLARVEMDAAVVARHMKIRPTALNSHARR